MLAAVVWFITGLAGAAPGGLLLTNGESRLPQTAGTALLIAGGVACVIGAICALRSPSRRLLPAGAIVVALCAAAPLVLEVDGRVSPGGWIMFGGAAGALAVLASALTLRASTGGASRRGGGSGS